MKRFPRLFLVLMAIVAMLVSACGGATSSVAEDTSLGSNKPLASLVEVQGYIEGINGNQWTINGQVVTVDASMLDDDDDLGDYQVGDYIEIKAEVSTDGSLIAREVDSSDDGNENDDSNDNDDDSNSNDDNDSNDNDDDSNGNNDDDSNDNDDDSNSNDDDSNDNDDDSNGNNDDDSNDNGDDSNDDDDNENDD